jgi:predicted DNA-binding transcriptional regulator AlpA
MENQEKFSGTVKPQAPLQAVPVPVESPCPKTLRKSALAKRFDVCTRTIKRHVEEGLLPPPDFYVGRFPHWIESNIDRWIKTKKLV